MHSVLPAWRQVLLFQSPRQLASHGAGTLATIAAGFFLFIGLPRLMGHGAIPPDILAGRWPSPSPSPCSSPMRCSRCDGASAAPIPACSRTGPL